MRLFLSKTIVLCIHKLIKPIMKNTIKSECHGVIGIDEYEKEVELFGFIFREFFTYGNYGYEIEKKKGKKK